LLKPKLLISFLLLMLMTLTVPLFAQEEDPPPIRWVRYYQSDNFRGRHCWFYDVFAVRGGGYVCGGYIFTERNRHRGWLLVTNEGGDVIHDLTYNYVDDGVAFTHGYSVIKTDDGGYLMGGRTQIGAVEQMNFDVIKINPNGETEWWEVITESDRSVICHAVIELKAGNFVVAGGENYRPYAALIDEEGEIIWENTYEGHVFRSVREIAGGGLLFAVYSGQGYGLLVKTDTDGEEIWNRNHFGGSYFNLISMRNGGFAAGGSAINNQGFFLSRINDNGHPQWSRNYQMPDSTRSTAYGLGEMPDGGMVMAGNGGRVSHSM